ncbi:MAG: shikimate dehydrogenase [Verrucomicrobiaceae bacterium]|nr:shikimate dehydrogenase [Verrucomicrobiaceae bacterium]
MIYQPKDLSESIFNNSTVKFAVFGKPIAHSLSPLMQNEALAELAKSDKKYLNVKYYAFEVDAQALGEVLDNFHSRNFVGINLTIPHKEVVVPFLKEIDISVKQAKACNTLQRIDGGWRGFNTDGIGLEYAILHSLNKSIKGADIVLLGAGGAARGASFHLLRNGCKSLMIANRSQERLQKLISDIHSEGFECKALELSENIKIPENAIVINCTSIGLKDDDLPILDFSKVPQSAVFFDMPYRRGEQTNSVKSATKYGIKAQSGLSMLAWQGAKSLSIWTNHNFEDIAKTMYTTLGL